MGGASHTSAAGRDVDDAGFAEGEAAVELAVEKEADVRRTSPQRRS